MRNLGSNVKVKVLQIAIHAPCLSGLVIWPDSSFINDANGGMGRARNNHGSMAAQSRRKSWAIPTIRSNKEEGVVAQRDNNT